MNCPASGISRAMRCLAAIGFAGSCALAFAQSDAGCSPPRGYTQLEPVELISPEQEQWLGDAIAAELQQSWRLVDDARIAALPASILERLSAHLPEPKPNVRLFIVDLPAVNALAMPGGRIYVTRQAVAFLRDENELAALLAHELAHVAFRHSARSLARLFDQLLDIKSLGDRQAAVGHYHRLSSQLAAQASRVARIRQDSIKTEVGADELALFLLASSGYRLESFGDMFDRLAGTEGRTGNILADLFGATSEEAKRLRLMIRTSAKMPAACAKSSGASTPESFSKWQALVAEWRGSAGSSKTVGLISKGRLNPPLRAELTRLRFSPDGRFILAQDELGLNILTVQPFALAFRIDAPDALDVQFTPDSAAIVFRDMNQHIERWSLAGRDRVSSLTVSRREPCVQALLSPDGARLVCVEQSGTVELIDTAAGAALWKSELLGKRPLSSVFQSQLLWLGTARQTVRASVQMAFTPDGKYWLASSNLRGDSEAVLWDVATGRELPLAGPLKSVKQRGFTLLGSNSVLIPPDRFPGEFAIVSLPGGEQGGAIRLPGAQYEAASRSDYLLLRPFMSYAAAIIDLKSKEAVRGVKGAAVDLYGDAFVAERAVGEIGLFDIATNKLRGSVRLPNVAASSFESHAFSPGLRFLALSGRDRAHVWDLQSNRRIATLDPLRAPSLGEDAKLRALLTAMGERSPKLWTFDLAAGKLAHGLEFTGSNLALCGPVVLQSRTEKSFVLAGINPDTGEPVWKVDFERSRPLGIHANCERAEAILIYPINSDEARTALKDSHELKLQRKTAEESAFAWVLRTMSLDTGKIVRDHVVGSKTVMTQISTHGDWVVVCDASNLIHAVAKHDGKITLRTVGRILARSNDGRWVLVKAERGRMQLIDLSGVAAMRELVAPNEPVFAKFDGSGNRILVLTNQQEVLETTTTP